MCCAGILYPQDTFNGFHKIGFNVFLSAFAVLVIHGTFSYPSQEGWLPDPFFSVKINNIHKCKHGSDSESYDTEGRFVPVRSPIKSIVVIAAAGLHASETAETHARLLKTDASATCCAGESRGALCQV